MACVDETNCNVQRSVAAVAAVLLALLLSACSDKYEVETLTSTKGYVFVLTADRFVEPGHDQGLYCEVQGDGVTVYSRNAVALTNLSTAGLAFELIELDGGNSVALVEKSDPHVVLVLCDFKSRTGLPADRSNRERRRGRALLKRFPAAPNGKPYKLSDDARGDEGTRLGYI